MAILVNDGNINWSGNWQTTGQAKTLHASTSLNVDSGTSQYSVAWDGNASNTNRGVLVYLTTSSSPTTAKTITATLEEDANDDGNWADATARASTTFVLNTSTPLFGWYYFKYSSTHTETAGTANYRIKLSGNHVNDTGFRADNASTTNIAIVQVLDATATLASGNHTIIVGVVQGSTGTPTAATVTMDINDSSTVFGSITVAPYASLVWGNSAGSTYYLRIDGNANITGTGLTYVMWLQNYSTYTQDVSSAVSGTLDLNSSITGYIFISDYSTFTTKGANNINGVSGTTSTFRTTSTSTISATGTTLVVSNTTGWIANDYITISGTDAAGHTEMARISSVDSGTQVTLVAGVTYTHLSGCEVCNMTRNCRIIRTGSAIGAISSGFTNAYGVPTVSITYTQFGDPSDGTKGLLCATGNYASSSVYLSGGNPILTFQGCTLTNCGVGSASTAALFISSTSTAICSHTIIYAPLGVGLHYKSNPLSSTSYISIIKVTYALAPCAVNASGNYATLLNNLVGLHVYDGIYGAMSVFHAIDQYINCKFWFNTYGFHQQYIQVPVKFISCYFGSDGTNTCGNTSGDIIQGGYSGMMTIANLYNCYLMSTVPLAYITKNGLSTGNRIKYMMGVFSQRHNGVEGRYKSMILNGIISDQITAGYTANYAKGGSGLCVCLDPNITTAGNFLQWEYYIPVTASTPFTHKFYITKSAAGWNGSANVTIYDSIDNYTALLDASAITVGDIPTNDGSGDDWTYQWSSGSLTPNSSGLCRVLVSVLNGSTTGDIFIDGVTTT